MISFCEILFMLQITDEGLDRRKHNTTVLSSFHRSNTFSENGWLRLDIYGFKIPMDSDTN